ncbi:MAG: 3-deoxy-8-phosphooctulonate synthase [Bacteroidetes bacterium]|nr:MAG: 3-deoxy-8-phosphooctulonate synthase [Bacteroidota bacterium]
MNPEQSLERLVPGIRHTESKNFFLFAGPCVVESREMVLDIASQISALSDKYKIPYVFKASYRKANRSRLDSFTGIGDQEALEILRELRSSLGLPVVSDVHSPEEAMRAAEYVDVLQVPAFLCRQTDLLTACAATGKAVSVKKGQFLSPEAMQFVLRKILDSGNNKVFLTERGTTFGYQDLVVDFRSIPLMQKNACPVILDVTHSLQQPNQGSGVSGGQPEMIATLARAGIAAGVDGLFMETHPDPPTAKSDGANMLALEKLDTLLASLVKIREAM